MTGSLASHQCNLRGNEVVDLAVTWELAEQAEAELELGELGERELGRVTVAEVRLDVEEAEIQEEELEARQDRLVRVPQVRSLPMTSRQEWLSKYLSETFS